MYSLVLLAALAASPMTLKEIEAEAIANNAEVRSAELQARVAESKLGSVAALDDPQLGYRAWSVPLVQPWNVNQTQHMFMFTQNVPGKGKRELKYLIASDEADLQASVVEAKKREVVALVRQSFYQLLRSYDQIRIHHDQVAVAERTIEATRIQYAAGKVPQRDVLQSAVAYQRLAEHLIMFEREADSSRAQLNTLMGHPPDQDLEIQGEYEIIEHLPSQEELFEIAVRNRPELRAFAAFEKQATHKIQLAQKGLKPDYTVSAGYMLMPAGAMNRNGWIAEFSMTLPWLNRGKYDAVVDETHNEAEAVRAEYQKQRAAIARQIRDAVIRTESARKVIDLYRDTLRPDIQNISKAATVAYQTNQSGLLSVLDAQNMSIDAEYAFFDALSEYEKSLAELEQAIGQSLPGERKPL